MTAVTIQPNKIVWNSYRQLSTITAIVQKKHNGYFGQPNILPETNLPKKVS